MGVASLVLGIIGVITCWIPVWGLIIGLLGLIFAFVGLSSAKKAGKSKGMPIAGLVLNGITLLVQAYYIIIVGAAVNAISQM